MLDSDEQDIINYLNTCPTQFVSGREICRRAAGKKRFNDEPYWASQVLVRLVEKKLLEMDPAGHYRIKQEDRKEERRKRWISPEIEQLLRESGKDFEGIIETETPREDQNL